MHAKQEQKGKMKEYENLVTLFCSTDTGYNAGFVFKKSIREVFLSFSVIGGWFRKSGDSDRKFSRLFL